MKNEILNDYLIEGKININKIIDEFYRYVYKIVKNSITTLITDEDIEEIVSDVFLAVWKNSNKLSNSTVMKPYIAGITKNIIRNKYREIKLDFSISDYEETLKDICNIEEIIEQKEQYKIIQNTLHMLKENEYKIFILFYYQSKTIKDISEQLNLSNSNVKTILYRIRKLIKKNLENGGYSYGKQ